MATLSQSMRNRLPQFNKKTALITAAVVLMVAVGIAVPTLRSQSAAATVGTTVVLAPTDISASITATGSLNPLQEANLSFLTGGRVADVAVDSGDVVAAGAALVTLDQTMLSLGAQSAQAGVDQATADVAAAKAQLTAAEAVLVQTVGSVGAADIAAARANLTAAQSRLALLQDGNKPEALARAQAAVTDAETGLAAQRTALSAAKTQAELLVSQRANAVRDAQTAYASAREDLAHVEADGTDPRTGRDLTDAQKRDYADAFTTAERALTNAEGLLVQAQRDADVARQNEITGVATAEARLNSAQADLDALRGGAGADLATAQAAVATAEAALNRLIGNQRDASVAAQEANVAAARAGVDRATAKLAQANALLQMANQRVSDTVLTAPFGGAVADVTARVGETVGTAPVVTMVDLSAYEVNVTVDEVDVAQIAVGQQVDVLVDALGEPALKGTVARVSPAAQSDRGVVSYAVTVQVTPDERAFRAGMTASAQIITASATGAIGVPHSAIHQTDGAPAVTVVVDGKRVERPVTLGIRGTRLTQVTDGLTAGEVVEIAAVTK
ncbi:MAG: hypothetical protein RLZZ297_1194 [Chloroflexota bacterium]